jgi:hypothetical protein
LLAVSGVESSPGGPFLNLQGARLCLRVSLCVGRKLKNIFWEKAPKSWRMAVMASNNRLIFRPITQLMYALSRVNCALTASVGSKFRGLTAVTGGCDDLTGRRRRHWRLPHDPGGAGEGDLGGRLSDVWRLIVFAADRLASQLIVWNPFNRKRG